MEVHNYTWILFIMYLTWSQLHSFILLKKVHNVLLNIHNNLSKQASTIGIMKKRDERRVVQPQLVKLYSDTTNDNKSEWLVLDAKLCLLLKGNPPSPVCDGPPIWAAICCTGLWHLVSSAAKQQAYDRSKMAAAFLAPSSQCGVCSSMATTLYEGSGWLNGSCCNLRTSLVPHSCV